MLTLKDVLILNSWKEGKVFRPAGFRQPKKGENYICKEGKIRKSDGTNIGNRTIIRELRKDENDN